MFYLKLACSNLFKNRKMMLPYLLAAGFSVMMIYMLRAISADAGIEEIFGGAQIRFILQLGNVVMSVFCVFFLFYINSFLMKRRKKELGLYNILGMGKKHLALVLFFETLISALIALFSGIIGGIIFGRLLFRLLMVLLHFENALTMGFNPGEAMSTVLLFTMIFTATYLFNLREVAVSKPIELVKGDKTGEKEPKSNLFLALLGTLCLAGGYAISLAIESPLEAILWFFVAVLLVILGTHALFTSVSIVVLKLLRKNKRFYYQPEHFTAVSGMLWRMKQNAAGLANICILSTCVLVMLSTTISLYAGMEDSLRVRYPHNLLISSSNVTMAEQTEINAVIADVLQEETFQFANEVDYRMFSVSIWASEQGFISRNSSENGGREGILMILPLSEYNRLAKSTLTLEADEVLLRDSGGHFTAPEIELFSERFKIKEVLNDFPIDETFRMGYLFDSYALVVRDEEIAKKIYTLATGNTKDLSWSFAIDVLGGDDLQNAAAEHFRSLFNERGLGVYVENAASSRTSFYGLYGGLLFIGLFLGMIFLVATVLIIYYKQISEGYDDAGRFEIMQKVGMSRKEVKKTIHSQVMMVFFLPLLIAIVHVGFAFPIISKLLAIFNFGDNRLFIYSTVGVIAVFAVFYFTVYSLTAKAYTALVEH